MSAGADAVAIASWQDASDADVDALCDAERSRWIEGLEWDPSVPLAAARAARASGIDSGLVARDSRGSVRGWALFAVGRGDLRIGTLAGDDRAVGALLDVLAGRANQARCPRVSCFLYPASDTVVRALQGRGFDLFRHHYLRRDLDPAGSVDPSAPWPPPGLTVVPAAAAGPGPLARLLARAYAGTPMAARFAPHAALEEWAAWVGQVFAGLACGELLPPASLALQDDGGRTVAAALTTRIHPGVSHLAQLVVDPALRRQRVARGLMSAALAAAARRGCSAVTLMVAEDNAPALALYRALGFEEVGHLLWGQVPTRSFSRGG